MKFKKKILQNNIKVYFVSAIIPIIIILVCSIIFKVYPFGNNALLHSDGYYQYPALLLEFKYRLLNGNFFYSFHGGLGFDFYANFVYYCTSPLNFFIIFFNSKNLHIFLIIITYLRFALLSLSMCFYLKKRNIENINCIIFSIIYSLTGYSIAFYFNIIWIDSVILLPIVIYGLEKLINTGSWKIYVISLTLSIYCNFYIGFMICIFSLLYFLYYILSEKKYSIKIFKDFLIYSLCCGLFNASLIIPTYFASKTGKLNLSFYIDFSNYYKIPYSLLSGTISPHNYQYGKLLLYSSIIVLTFSIMYFFNKKYDFRKKICTIGMLLIFYLSFTIYPLYLFWHMFKQPTFFPGRFTFIFSFFLIVISSDSFQNREYIHIKNRTKIILITCVIIMCLISSNMTIKTEFQTNILSLIGIIFSIILLILYLCFYSKKGFKYTALVLTFLDLFLNTFVVFKNWNDEDNATYPYFYSNDKENFSSGFYRTLILSDASCNAGLLEGYNNSTFCSSIYNYKLLETTTYTGISSNLSLTIGTYANSLYIYNPLIFSIYNIKYIKSEYLEYFKIIDKKNNLYVNNYPLSLGFIINNENKLKEIKYNKNTELKDVLENLNTISNEMFGRNTNLFKFILANKFKQNNNQLIYSFKAKSNYLLYWNSNEKYEIKINDKQIKSKSPYLYINKDDYISINYYNSTKLEDILVCLFNVDKYENIMEEVSSNVLVIDDYDKSDYLIKGHINVTSGNTYLFTSIPNEKGMKVYVDNKEITPDVLLDSLIGIDLKTTGKHEIIIKYYPPWLNKGVIITAFGILLIIIYTRSSIKKNKKKILIKN